MGLVSAAAIGLDETSSSSKTVQGVKAGGALFGVFAGGLPGGYSPGRAADRDVTVITITGD